MAASDGRTVVIVPEVKGDRATGITLLHVRLPRRPVRGAARGVLQGYRGRYAALRDAVTETEPTFRDDLLDDRARRRPAHRADLPSWPTAGARRDPRRDPVIGVGVDLCEVDRFRTVLARTPGPRPRCSPTTSGPTATAARTPPSATPPASRPRRR